MKLMEQMTKKIKLSWDFRGPDGAKTAEHYTHHLEEFIVANKLKNRVYGTEDMTKMHSASYMLIDEVELEAVKRALRPHRIEDM